MRIHFVEMRAQLLFPGENLHEITHFYLEFNSNGKFARRKIYVYAVIGSET